MWEQASKSSCLQGNKVPPQKLSASFYLGTGLTTRVKFQNSPNGYIPTVITHKVIKLDRSSNNSLWGRDGASRIRPQQY